jgi:hypothetical protein
LARVRGFNFNLAEFDEDLFKVTVVVVRAQLAVHSFDLFH